MEFSSYPSKHWKSGPFFDAHWFSYLILLNTGILALYFYKHWNSYLLLALKALELWSYFCKHWNSHLILPNIGILALFVFMHVGIIILSFQTLESWPYNLYYTLEFSPHPFKHWNFAPIIFYSHWNSGPILRNMGIFVILPLQTLKFWLCRSKHWNFRPIYINIAILILSFQTL